jgi:molybdopterin converting factor small subunit
MPTVQVKLYATLRQYRPDAVQGQPVTVVLEVGATIADLLQKLGIPRDVTKQCFVNGLQKGLDYMLRDGDSVGIFPPVAGG